MSLGYEKAFNKQIQYIIELLEHDFLVVHLDRNFKCTCLKEGTNQPDPYCKRCLGTGYRIKIKKGKGAVQTTDIPPTVHKGSGVLMTFDYYISQPTNLKRGDYIIDNGSAYLVNEVQSLTSFKYEKVFLKANCIIKKNQHDLFMKLFNETIKKEV